MNEIRTEADIAPRKLGRDVNVTVLRPAEWDAADSGFIAHVKDGPLVELDLKNDAAKGRCRAHHGATPGAGAAATRKDRPH